MFSARFFLKESGISDHLFPCSYSPSTIFPFVAGLSPVPLKGTTDTHFRARVTTLRGTRLPACIISYLQVITGIWISIGASKSDAHCWEGTGLVRWGTGVLKSIPVPRGSDRPHARCVLQHLSSSAQQLQQDLWKLLISRRRGNIAHFCSKFELMVVTVIFAAIVDYSSYWWVQIFGQIIV